MVDEYTRGCVAIDMAGSIRSSQVIEVLSQLISIHGAPSYLQSNIRPECGSVALWKGAVQQKIGTPFLDGEARETVREVETATLRVTQIMLEICAANAEQAAGVAQIGQAVV